MLKITAYLFSSFLSEIHNIFFPGSPCIYFYSNSGRTQILNHIM